eukprot:300070_1
MWTSDWSDQFFDPEYRAIRRKEIIREEKREAKRKLEWKVTVPYLISTIAALNKCKIGHDIKLLISEFTVTKPMIINSRILDLKSRLLLLQIIGKYTHTDDFHCRVNAGLIEYKLLYRASQFRWKKFHKYCDGKKDTITVAINKNGDIFGGYIHEQWNKKIHTIYDKNAFLFCIKSKYFAQLKKIKLKSRIHKTYNLNNRKGFGPCFGNKKASHGLWISNKCKLQCKNCQRSDLIKLNKKELRNRCDVQHINAVGVYSKAGLIDKLCFCECRGHDLNNFGVNVYHIIDYEVFQMIHSN